MTALLITHLLACTPATVGLDDTGDTGTTTEPPDPVPDLTVWDAELYFSYESWTGDCEPELVSELGGPPEDFEIEPLLAACPGCTALYEAFPSTTEVCGWIELPDSDMRGLVLGDDWAQVYRFEGNASDGYEAVLLDNTATFDGWTVAFAAEISYWVTLDVEGTLTFPEAPLGE